MAPPRDDLHAFFDTLCVDHGFCISAEAIEQISTAERIAANEFTVAVLKAEGLDPGSQSHWFRLIDRLFRARFGEEIVFRGVRSQQLENEMTQKKPLLQFLWTWLGLFVLLGTVFAMPLLRPDAVTWSAGRPDVLVWWAGGTLLASFFVTLVVHLFSVRGTPSKD